MSIKYSKLTNSVLLAFYDEIAKYKGRKSIFHKVIKELKRRRVKTK